MNESIVFSPISLAITNEELNNAVIKSDTITDLPEVNEEE
jgi:hypothetical protein